MYEVSNAFRQAMENENPQRVLLVFSNRSFSNEDISATSDLTMTEQFISQTDLTIGLCPSTDIHFELLNDDYHLNDFTFGKFTAYLGVQSDTAEATDFTQSFEEDGETKQYIFVPLGVFIASRPDVVRKRIISVSANDQMVLFDRDWPTGVFTFPCTMAELFVEMCEYLGVEYETTDFMNSTLTLSEEPEQFENATMREVLGWIAEAAGSIARFNRNGRLELAWFNQTLKVYDEHDYSDFSPFWFQVSPIDGLHVRNADSTEEEIIGNGSNSYMIQNNPFLRIDDTTQEETEEPTVQPASVRGRLRTATANNLSPAEQIYQRLANAPAYNPSVVDLFTDWTLQAGDVITVNSDEDSYTLPIYQLNLRWNGNSKVTAESTGNQEREPLPALARKQYTDNATNYLQYKANEIKFGSIDASIFENGESIQFITTKTGINGLGENENLFGKINFNADGITSLFTKTGVNSLNAGENLFGKISFNADGISSLFSKTGVNSLGESETLYSKITHNSEELSSLYVKTGVDELGNEETLYSKITQTAGEVSSLVSKTGVNSLGQNETLYSKITQTAEGVTSLVSKTGVDSLGNNETLYSKISQTADGVSSLVAKTGVDGLGNNETLLSKISQNADGVSSLVAKTGVNSLGNEETLFSKISQTSGEVSSLVSKTGVNSLGQNETLYSKITQTDTEIRTVVANATTAAAIVQKINDAGSSIVISADHIELDGDAVATSLESHSLACGAFTAEGNVHFLRTLYAEDYIHTDETLSAAVDVKVGNVSLQTAITGIGTATSSNGQITIPTTRFNGTAGPSINFNIADTQFYQDGVSAAEANGWRAAWQKVVPPSSGTGTSFEYKVPSETQGQQDTKTFTIQKGATPGSSGYASVALSGTVVGRIAIGDWYDAGVNAVTVSSITDAQASGDGYNSSVHKTRLTVKATASNGADKEVTFWSNGDEYSAGYTDGAGSINQRTASRTTISWRSGSSISYSNGVWSRAADATVYFSDGNSQSGVDVYGAIDVTSIVNAVSVYRGSWSGGSVTLSPRAAGNNTSGSSYTINLGRDVSWSGATGTIKIYEVQGGGVSKTDTGYSFTVDASAVDVPMYYWEDNTKYSAPSSVKKIPFGKDIMVGSTTGNRFWVGANSPSLYARSITSNGTYNVPSGYDGHGTITVSVSGGGSADASNILVGSYNWYDSSQASYMPSGVVYMSDFGALIKSHKNGQGYAVFKATISGGTGQKWYAVPVS